MMNIEFELVIETFNGRDVCVVLDVAGSVDNDGIGSYEYWGAKGFDAGSDYASVEDWEIVEAVFIDNGTPATLDGELRQLIRLAAKANEDEMQERMERELERERESAAADEADRRAEDRADRWRDFD